MSVNVTLKEAAEELECSYNTLRYYASKHKETAPKPLKTNASGNGILWNLEDWRNWLTNHHKTKGSGGAQYHKNSSARAKLGHEYKRIRELNECTAESCVEDTRHLIEGETIYEQRNSRNELVIFHEECYKRFCETP